MLIFDHVDLILLMRKKVGSESRIQGTDWSPLFHHFETKHTVDSIHL